MAANFVNYLVLLCSMLKSLHQDIDKFNYKAQC